ncbi:MAG: hypothetical protein CR982_06740 [Candidatus Cloacimonadota bacterium]|nr:MAG: hypothetical protein CR982_06740 [Candidatus Cloacimonadota bacterium]PIE77820.1 MAG: hypothetical protein CSA15_11025 [Candidatus Delongbacteria bacterium]
MKIKNKILRKIKKIDLSSVKDKKILNKINILKFSSQFGITKSSKAYNIDRKTIYNWRDNFLENGIDGLKHKPKIKRKGKKGVSLEEVKKIYLYRNSNPSKSIEEIKEILNISYSVSTIYRNLSTYKKNIKENKDIKYKREKYPQFILTHKLLKDTNYYIILIIDPISKIFFSGIAEDISQISSAIFVDYFITKMIDIVEYNNFTFFINRKKREYKSRENIFTKIVTNKHKCNLSNSGWKNIFKNFKYEKIVNQLEIKDNNLLILASQQLIINYLNNIKYGKNSFYKSTSNLFRISFSILPIFPNNFIKKIDTILDYNGDIKDHNYQHRDFKDIYSIIKHSIPFIQKLGINTKTIISYFEDLIDYFTFSGDDSEFILAKIFYQKSIYFYNNSPNFTISRESIISSINILKKERYKNKFFIDLSKSYLMLGKLEMRVGNNKKAITIFKRLYNYSNQLKNIELKSESLKYIAIINRNRSNYLLSEKLTHQLLELATNNNLLNKKIWAITNLGSIYYLRKKYQISKSYFHKAYNIGSISIEKGMLLFILSNLGLLYQIEKCFEKALNYYFLLLENSIKMRDSSSNIVANINIGSVYIDKEQYIKGLEYYEKAEAKAKLMMDNNNLYIIYTAKSYIYFKLDISSKALELIDKSIHIAVKNGNSVYKTKSEALKVEILYKKGELKKGVRLLNRLFKEGVPKSYMLESDISLEAIELMFRFKILISDKKGFESISYFRVLKRYNNLLQKVKFKPKERVSLNLNILELIEPYLDDDNFISLVSKLNSRGIFFDINYMITNSINYFRKKSKLNFSKSYTKKIDYLNGLKTIINR